MSLAPRLMAASLLGLASVTILAPTAAADPDIDTESAAAVVEELRAQGYNVEVKGIPGADTGLLTTCTVTTIHNPGAPSPDPTSTTTIYVEVACPIQHG
jgi:hypothetical protein